MLIVAPSWKKQQKLGQLGELQSQLFGGRYLLFFMGFFGFYVGWIYNDCFSLSIDAFGSKYNWQQAPYANATRLGDNAVYPFGVDPIW